MLSLVGLVASKPNVRPMTPAGTNGAADRLMTILDMSLEEYEAMFPVRENVFTYGRRTSLGRRLRREMEGPVIVLGKKAWQMLGLEAASWFSARCSSKAIWVLVPHPSGRNLMYNDATTRDKLRRIVWLLSRCQSTPASSSSKVSLSLVR